MLKPNDRTFTAFSVRLIGADGEQLNVVPLAKARELANQAGLDLVIVSEQSTPPVVRIMDFGKLRYEQKKNQKSQKRNAAAKKVKEVKFHINIDQHDYETKLKHAIDFLENGSKLKVTIVLRGREMAHQEFAGDLMVKITDSLRELADPDGTPKMLGRNLSVNFSLKPSVAKAMKLAAEQSKAAETGNTDKEK